MGWNNFHMHRFEIDGVPYGDPLLLDDGFDDFYCIDTTATRLSHIAPQEGILRRTAVGVLVYGVLVSIVGLVLL